MAKRSRFHIDDLPEGTEAPKHLTKQEFGRRLYRLMLARGWNQSELARQADLPRDSISTYIRGRTFPTPKSLQSLANALDVSSADLLPNAIASAIDEDTPSFEMKVSDAAPNLAWLRVNRLVTLATATKVAELIGADNAGKAADSA